MGRGARDNSSVRCAALRCDGDTALLNSGLCLSRSAPRGYQRSVAPAQRQRDGAFIMGDQMCVAEGGESGGNAGGVGWKDPMAPHYIIAVFFWSPILLLFFLVAFDTCGWAWQQGLHGTVWGGRGVVWLGSLVESSLAWPCAPPFTPQSTGRLHVSILLHIRQMSQLAIVFPRVQLPVGLPRGAHCQTTCFAFVFELTNAFSELVWKRKNPIDSLTEGRLATWLTPRTWPSSAGHGLLVHGVNCEHAG